MIRHYYLAFINYFINLSVSLLNLIARWCSHSFASDFFGNATKNDLLRFYGIFAALVYLVRHFPNLKIVQDCQQLLLHSSPWPVIAKELSHSIVARPFCLFPLLSFSLKMLCVLLKSTFFFDLLFLCLFEYNLYICRFQFFNPFRAFPTDETSKPNRYYHDKWSDSPVQIFTNRAHHALYTQLKRPHPLSHPIVKFEVPPSWQLLLYGTDIRKGHYDLNLFMSILHILTISTCYFNLLRSNNDFVQ